jgi:hypothetical protein
MLWIIVIGILAFIIGKFFIDWNKQNEKLLSEGGLRNKYSELIKLLQSDSNPKIFQSDLDTYSFGWITPNADQRFYIMQTFEFVTIKWVFKGRILFLNKTITLSNEWKFSQNGNQEKMAEKILTDISEIYNNSEFGQY